MREIAILVFGVTILTGCSGECERVGAHWQTCTPPQLMTHGTRHERLFEVGLLGTRELESFTFDVRPLTKDCVFYGSTRGGEERYYTACYGREPLLLAVSRDEWRVEEDRLVRARPVHFDGCEVVETFDVIDLRKRAPEAAARNRGRSSIPLAPEPYEVRTSATAKLRDGRVPLVEAAAFGTLGDVRRLLECGADLNAKDEHGVTALMNACGAARYDPTKIETAQYLISHGADVRARDSYGHDALFQTCGNLDLESALIKAGADAKSCVHDDGTKTTSSGS